MHLQGSAIQVPPSLQEALCVLFAQYDLLTFAKAPNPESQQLLEPLRALQLAMCTFSKRHSKGFGLLSMVLKGIRGLK